MPTLPFGTAALWDSQALAIVQVDKVRKCLDGQKHNMNAMPADGNDPPRRRQVDVTVDARVGTIDQIDIRSSL